MDRLAYVIIFTGDLAGMREFYEDRLRLVAREPVPDWVEFETAGATLALHAMPDRSRRGIQLRFATDDIEASVRALAARGLDVDGSRITRAPWGRIVSFADAEGNPLTLWQPSIPPAAGAGPALSAVVNCRDMAAQSRFYRETLGLAAVIESDWWVQLAAGDAGLGLHPETAPGPGEGHHGGGVTIGLGVPDLPGWYEDRSARGVDFMAPPVDRGFGLFVDTTDPDGHPLTVREAPDRRSLEERLAEPFEDETAPRRTSIRRPVRKGVAGTSRAATRPPRTAAKAVKATKRRRAATSAARSASPRGTGPAGSRQKPRRRRNTERARTKPAIGRLKKAERRSVKSKKQAVARTSKRKPVKRASARPARRTAARRTTARRGGGRR